MARVFVAMSGGVDSSVAAALLLEQGHDVTGITMQLWPSSDTEGGCCSVSAIRDAKRVCDLLGIPHYALNYREILEREVVTPFALEYAAGRTPNPCIVCNDRVKFSDLLAKVSAQGADFLATGHYARVTRDDSGQPWLATGLDSGKDQSYFLYRLTPNQLEHVVFPVGELHKTEVRAMAIRFGLPVASKAESQETCFGVDGDYSAVLAERVPDALLPGPIVDAAGREIGRHEGVGHFTVGQRKGLGIGGSNEPLYVVGIDAAHRTVTVGPRAALLASRVVAADVVWRAGPSADVTAAVRYRMAPAEAKAAYGNGGRLTVTFEAPIEGISPGQSVVCYEGDRVVGGGVVTCAD